MRRGHAHCGAGCPGLVDEDIPFNQIVSDYYPDLTVEDVHACIRYAIALVGAEDIRLRPATG